MITKANGMASLRCDQCGRRHASIAKIREIRWLAARSRADGWRCFWGPPKAFSTDWPNGRDGWRHACPQCVSDFIGRQKARLF